jgi:GntR family transcriptional repressor for pyruvate dehydrogenase complex
MAITSAARQAADMLAEEILGHEGDEEEWALGSESDLMATLGIGRPTLRQAARLLEQQQLLIVRRGIGGGLFGRRPSEEGVSATASVFLRSQHTTFRDLLQAHLMFGPECASLAAQNPDLEERTSLTKFYSSEPFDGDEIPLRAFMEATPRFQAEVARLSRNPVFYLFISVLMDLASQSTGIADAYRDPERRTITVVRHREIANAVRAGQSALAAKRMRQHLQALLDWSDDRVLGQTLERRRH